MTKDDVKLAVRATPFQPFVVRLVDGTRYEIPTADHASVSPNGRTLVVFREDGTRLIDTSLIIEMIMPQSA
jgi:hypothetical protein